MLAVLIDAYRDEPDVTIYCEPTLARGHCHLPDLVVVDPASGVHVLEVKGVDLEHVAAVNAGEIAIVRNGRRDRSCPLKQARRAMFEVKRDAEVTLGEPPRLPFLYWAIFTGFTRSEWCEKWGESAFLPDELLFVDDLREGGLRERFVAAGASALSALGIGVAVRSDMAAVHLAFGDSEVLRGAVYGPGPAREGSLGEYCREAVVDDTKQLTDEQQRLANARWDGHPHVVRGVAGSGKSIVLAANLARLVQRWADPDSFSFEDPGTPRRTLAVCFNRTLVPFLLEKIGRAYAQRTHDSQLPSSVVEVRHINGLMFHLSQKGLWEYQSTSGDDTGARNKERAAYYLEHLEAAIASHLPVLDEALYDAIYVDEGQDLLEDELRLLTRLCRKDELTGKPSLFIFYDDAQNLYGRRLPNWKTLGIDIAGNADVMRECHRNTAQIVESAFNLLLGAPRNDAKLKTFADTRSLEKRGLVVLRRDGFWRVSVATRQGAWPTLARARTPQDETRLVVDHVRWLLEEQDVPPEEILVLSPEGERLEEVGEAIRKDLRQSVALPFRKDEKDRYIFRAGELTASTIHTAKGYDACCVVLLWSEHPQRDDRSGRVSFYVGATRARDHLHVVARAGAGLADEFEHIVSALSAGATS